MVVFLSALFMLFCSSVLEAANQPKLVVGWVERVAIYPGGVILSAKIDTGAVSCSLHTQSMELFQRNGRNLVRLKMFDQQGNETVIEAPIVGKKRIRRHFGRFQDRPVIRLKICLGTFSKDVDVNLVDRSGLDYPLLIGRNFMAGALLVNPSEKFTIEPSCASETSEDQRDP
jgi:hypothetical protein